MTRLAALVMFVAAIRICMSAPDEGPKPSHPPQPVLHEGMEWVGTFTRATVKKKAPYILSHKKVKNVDVDRFRLSITSVEGSAISGQFNWHQDEGPAAVKFQGAVGKNGQFQFAITNAIKGDLGAAFIRAALVGNFGPNAETISGVFSSQTSRRVGSFEGHLQKESAKTGKKKGRKR